MNKSLKISCASFFILAVSPLAASTHTVIEPTNIDWGMLNPARGAASPKAFDLWGDRTKDEATGMLVKFNKGFTSPPHIHNISYRGVVIEGLMHNDDPGAIESWLPVGSYWLQPAGETHITAARGQTNLIYLEIDSGPYLVLNPDKAFDNGQRPINVDPTNLIWLTQKDARWVDKNNAKIAYLWGDTSAANGSFVKLPAGFKGTIESESGLGLKAVVVKGKTSYSWQQEPKVTELSPTGFFSSEGKGEHHLHTKTETLLYINSNGEFNIE